MIESGREADQLQDGKEDKGAGNLSIRTTKGCLITIHGCHLENLSKADFIEVGSDPAEWQKQNASSETGLHMAIYRARNEVNAIIHCHDTTVMDEAVDLDLVITQKYAEPGSSELVQEVLAVLGQSNYVILRGHGICSLGKTLEEAGQRLKETHEIAGRLAKKRTGG
jgi:L-fuculose-phosphate aldolase